MKKILFATLFLTACIATNGYAENDGISIASGKFPLAHSFASSGGLMLTDANGVQIGLASINRPNEVVSDSIFGGDVYQHITIILVLIEQDGIINYLEAGLDGLVHPTSGSLTIAYTGTACTGEPVAGVPPRLNLIPTGILPVARISADGTVHVVDASNPPVPTLLFSRMGPGGCVAFDPPREIPAYPAIPSFNTNQLVTPFKLSIVR